MKKQGLFILFSLLMATVTCIAGGVKSGQYPGAQIPLQTIYNPITNYDDSAPILFPRPKSPMEAPAVYQDGYTLYMDNPEGYGIEIIDAEDETVVYSSFIPTEVTTWQLPSTLNGNYVIRLTIDNWMFVGEIFI